MPISLPDAIRYDTFSGTLEDYIYHLYELFKTDFYTNEVTFLRKKVLVQRDPMMDGQVYTFNHITKYDILHPDIDKGRSKKIPWLAPILNGCPDSNVKCWEVRRKSGKKWVTRVNVWYEQFQFLLILQPKDAVYFLITAYTKGGARNIQKLNDEYNNSSDKLY